MGFLDRLLGRAPQSAHPEGYAPYQPDVAPPSADAVAIERYRYLLRTAPPHALEEAHAEAFARLTPERRRQVLTELGAQVPPAERATSDDPRSLARMATRAEVRSPGTLERTFSRGGMGPGTGGVIAGSLFASLAGAVIGTAIAGQLLEQSDAGTDHQASETGDEGHDGAGTGDGGAYAADDSGGDFGGDDSAEDFGGDFGGGDIGGW